MGDNIEISCPICVTALVTECTYVFHESITWWGVQKTASADLLGFELLETSLFVRLHRGAAHSKKNALFNVSVVDSEVDTMTSPG